MPRLLDNAPHIVEVQNRRVDRDVRGNRVYVPVGARQPVPCAVQPVREWSTAEETYGAGIQLMSLLRVFSRNWPGNTDSLIYFNGIEYESVGDPQLMNMSRRTRHWEITIKRIGVDD
jgi:hypothetical protein